MNDFITGLNTIEFELDTHIYSVYGLFEETESWSLFKKHCKGIEVDPEQYRQDLVAGKVVATPSKNKFFASWWCIHKEKLEDYTVFAKNDYNRLLRRLKT
jgi:hypothetical protein